jgi:hypothetical protein
VQCLPPFPTPITSGIPRKFTDLKKIRSEGCRYMIILPRYFGQGSVMVGLFEGLVLIFTTPLV